MDSFPKTIEFEWNKGNLDKRRRKHGITPEETESLFWDDHKLIIPDAKHSQDENRQIILGKSIKQRFLFVVFTLRSKKIRIISARRMHRKEVEKYGQVEKNT